VINVSIGTTPLRNAGYLAMGGQIVDATVVKARSPRRIKGERATVKHGGVPAAWSKAKRAQMDTKGRWTLKRGRKRSAERGEPHQRTQSETRAIVVEPRGAGLTLGELGLGQTDPHQDAFFEASWW
jgi:hypothetical protein